MRAGALDRRVRIEQRQETNDPVFGTVVVTWAELATVWAEVRDMIPSRGERVAEGLSIARRPCRVRMRWRDDVNSTMRLVMEDGRTLRIVGGPAELGRAEGIELVCEELTTEGQEP